MSTKHLYYLVGGIAAGYLLASTLKTKPVFSAAYLKGVTAGA